MRGGGLRCHGAGAFVRPAPSALFIDLYELTMAQAYFELGMHDTAVFELFVRRLPRTRRFLVAAGLQQALEYVEQLHFTAEDLGYLSDLGTLSSKFLDLPWRAALHRLGARHAGGHAFFFGRAHFAYHGTDP